MSIKPSPLKPFATVVCIVGDAHTQDEPWRKAVERVASMSASELEDIDNQHLQLYHVLGGNST